MLLKLKFPIRYKILGVLVAVLVSAVGFYLWLASKVFFEDKNLLVYELNQNSVRVVSAEIDARLQKAITELKLNIFDDPNLQRVVTVDKKNKLKVVFERDGYHRALVNKAKGIKRLSTGDLWLENISTSNPMQQLLFRMQFRHKSKIIVADFQLDTFFQNVPRTGIARVYLLDSRNRVLFHPDLDRVLSKADMSLDPLTEAAKKSKVRSEVRRFENNGEPILGTFYKPNVSGLTVYSRTEVGHAFAAAKTLVRRSLLYAAIIITGAFLIALFFSHSLTLPVRKMLDVIHEVSRGNFDKKVEVSTRDELAVLARAFNSMSSRLKTSRMQIEEYSRDLEKKVAERTAKLEAQNVAIKDAQEALVRTTRLASVGEVAGRAAHEVLNPLTSISARLEKMHALRGEEEKEDLHLMKEILSAWKKDLSSGGVAGLLKAITAPSTVIPGKTLLEEDLGNLEQIFKGIETRKVKNSGDVEFLLKETGRISKIVNGMRQLTRVSSERKVVSLEKVVEEAKEMMADLFKKHSILFEILIEAKGIQIQVDKDEILQVFSNLFRNSVQAIQEAKEKGLPCGDPAKIMVSVAKASDELVQVRVADNGPGIAPESHGSVFEPSFTTKKSSDGTGLGLSISRRLVRAAGGELNLEMSEPGKQTVFLMEIPIYT
ncbi:MAG: ATP-binding protein [Bacteriovoracia bacterium]